MRRWWPLAGLGLLAAAVLAGAFVPGTTAVAGLPWTPPGAGHPLGTDVLGRDVLARTLAGGAAVLGLALPSGLLTTALGTLAGLAATAKGERLLARLSGGVLMVPSLLLVLIGAVVLPYWAAVPVVVLLLGVPMSARVIHATARPLRRAGFVEAAVAHGESPVRELLPAVAGTVLGDLGLRIATALQLAVAVTVLGAGPPPPAADWAAMLRENLPGADLNPWSVLAPAGALAGLAVAVTLALDLTGRGRTRKRPVIVHKELSETDGLVLRGTWHGGDRVLHLDVRVETGTVLGVTGASGAGKTSLLRLLLGDLPRATTSWHGSLAHRGTVIRPGTARARRWRRKHVGFLGQDPALDPLRRIGSSVSDGLRRRDARAVFELLDLPEGIGRRYPHQISGGEAQRVALARALAAEPDVLVLDEPTSALDGETLGRVTAALAGRTAVVVSHDRDWLTRVAHDVLDLGQESLPLERPVVRAGEPVFRGGGLELHEGELVVLLGKSGAGKTTLLRRLSRDGLLRRDGWARPRPGEVELLRQDAFGALNPARTLADAVGRPLRVLHGVRHPRAEAVRLLAETGLGPEFAGRRPDECSGGQRQRAGLARALAARPRVLLADEPTSALDAAAAGVVLAALDRRRTHGLAVLLVTHDERLAARADRVLKIEEGQLR